MLSSMDDLELPRHEFRAEDGSFLLDLRVDLHWERRAFSRLEQAMRHICAQQEPSSLTAGPTWPATTGRTCRYRRQPLPGEGNKISQRRTIKPGAPYRPYLTIAPSEPLSSAATRTDWVPGISSRSLCKSVLAGPGTCVQRPPE
jgi:hypothetical protein